MTDGPRDFAFGNFVIQEHHSNPTPSANKTLGNYICIKPPNIRTERQMNRQVPR